MGSNPTLSANINHLALDFVASSVLNYPCWDNLGTRNGDFRETHRQVWQDDLARACVHATCVEHRVPEELWNVPLSVGQARENLENAFNELPEDTRKVVLEIEQQLMSKPASR